MITGIGIPNSQSKMPLPIVTTFLTGLWSAKNYWHDAELIEKIDVTASKSLDKKTVETSSRSKIFGLSRPIFVWTAAARWNSYLVYRQKQGDDYS
jgi:hypothetical protein